MDRATKTLSGQEAFVMRSNGLDPLPVWCISCGGFSGLYTTCEVVATSGVLCEHCQGEYQRELDDIERTRLPFAGEQGDWYPKGRRFEPPRTLQRRAYPPARMEGSGPRTGTATDLTTTENGDRHYEILSKSGT